VTPKILGGAKGFMAGSLVASQFLEAQNWALGSAMAMVLIGMILATIAVAALIALAFRTLIRRVWRIRLDESTAGGRP
jgi:spermidine/putrescine transport system permease protein